MASAAWTWMIYVATNNNVTFAGERSVALLRRVQYDESVRVLVQQTTPDGTVRRILGNVPEVVDDLGQIDSGDPAALVDFARWSATVAPARRYALVLWSHGSGWEPSEMERQAQQQPAQEPVTKTELTQRGNEDGRQVFFSTTLRRLLSLPTPPERAVAFDDGSGHSLDTIELGNVMEAIARQLGQPVDVLGMNACLMASVEVAYQIRQHARVYVASEGLVPAQSWPYDDILAALKAEPDVDAGALGKLIVERYIAAYRRLQPLPASVTLTALQLAGIDALAEAVRALAAGLRGDVQRQIGPIWNAQRADQPAFQFQLYDLAGFCRALLAQTGAVSQEILLAVQGVLAALADPALLLAADHLDPAYDKFGGVNTYLIPPLPGKTPSPYYGQTAYAQATNWGQFLADYHAAV